MLTLSAQSGNRLGLRSTCSLCVRKFVTNLSVIDGAHTFDRYYGHHTLSRTSCSCNIQNFDSLTCDAYISLTITRTVKTKSNSHRTGRQEVIRNLKDRNGKLVSVGWTKSNIIHAPNCRSICWRLSRSIQDRFHS
jgi:hypothetical protein